MQLSSSVATPPLLEGDSLTKDEFLRRWEAMPDLKHAELLDGIVFMSSPLSIPHGDHHSALNYWLASYAASTPGCRSSLEATWVMDERNVPQPDITLRILPEYGGLSQSEGVYAAGAAELITEVAVSSRSRDFGVKKRLYEKTGVREYIIALPERQELVWYLPVSARYQEIHPGPRGIFQSRVYPGLWLNPEDLWSLDPARLNATLQEGLSTPEHAEFAAGLAAGRR